MAALAPRLPLLLLAAGTVCLWRCLPPADATCVLDSDFGFVLNCGFRKSGLFRVRNLGGVKGYVGVGFSVGDELRFNESLSNVEPSNRRRSAASARSSGPGPAPGAAPNATPGASSAASVAPASANEQRRRPQLLRQLRPTVPPFKPIAPAPRAPAPAVVPAPVPAVAVPVAAAPAADALRIVPPPAVLAAPVSRPSRLAPKLPPPPPPPTAVPPFVALPASIHKVGTPAQPVAAAPAPLTPRPPAKAAPPPLAFRQALNAATNHFQVRKDVLVDPDVSSNLLTGGGPQAVLPTVPPRSPPRRAASPAVAAAPVIVTPATSFAAAAAAPALPIASSAASLVAAATAPAAANITVAEAVALATAIQRLAHAANVSAEALAAALAARRQQNIAALAAAAAVTNEASYGAPADPQPAVAATMPPPPSTTRHPLASISKVMNAPREYYPVGYDKNFDDNFASRVELPDTPFHCGEQKHFPGLYADEDLGCMVFHVCALTDHGLIMKSFLCPESTLFDQTILKCNWWFYVDCKSSKKLYDSNIPISKSYQLMKALAFFSQYNKS